MFTISLYDGNWNGMTGTAAAVAERHALPKTCADRTMFKTSQSTVLLREYYDRVAPWYWKGGWLHVGTQMENIERYNQIMILKMQTANKLGEAIKLDVKRIKNWRLEFKEWSAAKYLIRKVMFRLKRQLASIKNKEKWWLLHGRSE